MHTPVKPNLATMPVRGLLLDMDGVLYHGERPIAEAMEFLAALAYLPRACITNNPIASAAQVAARLSAMGFPETRPELILTSAEATAQWLRQQRPGFRYYAVGAPGLHLALSAVGVADAEQADFVVIGEGAGIDFDAITIGVNLIVHGGARLICTNPDHSVDTTLAGRRRILPGGGALVAPFAIAAGVTPLFIGKPEPLLYRMALQRLRLTAAECLMIGDRPDTDIAGAAALGMRTALVRSGRFQPGAPWPPDLPRADWDVTDLRQLLDQLEGHLATPI